MLLLLLLSSLLLLLLCHTHMSNIRISENGRLRLLDWLVTLRGIKKSLALDTRDKLFLHI